MQSLSSSALKEKKVKVDELMRLLDEDLISKSLTQQRHIEILEQLKVYGREPQGSDAIYSDDGLATLCKYAFENQTASISQAALRVIANALLLQPSFRVKLSRLGYAEALTRIYHRSDDNDEFLGGRILFLLTYGTDTDFASLIDSHRLAEAIESHLQRHGKQLANSAGRVSDMGLMALSETLKLLFNLANALPDKVQQLSLTKTAIFEILIHMKLPSPPLDPSLSTVVNALAILDFAAAEKASMDARQSQRYSDLSEKLVKVLEAAVDTYKPLQLDTTAIPLVTVLRKIYEVLPSDLKQLMQKALLPDDSERDLPLGQSTSLASKLLRLTSAPGLTNLPDSISALLFELSGKDASTFVKNIGYGYAAGYLMTHKIPIPESAKKTRHGKDGSEVPINPITGQRLDKETIPETIEMTDEEKEREAERLFVLFERLKATGVVDVKNPVEEAMEKGRFEELNDSDPD